MIKTKTFDLIDYANNLRDFSDNFWDGKLKTDIIQFITREKQVPQDNLKVIISHPYEGNVLIIDGEYILLARETKNENCKNSCIPHTCGARPDKALKGLYWGDSTKFVKVAILENSLKITGTSAIRTGRDSVRARPDRALKGSVPG